ncbi:hypothetical protein FRX31_012074 [Thalictrum thalictroides]|uniref:Uncharacterized protein n=1 Tax=Thalictrum thalictroides TaxID=46969 RepID=A0A7J6WLT9_THATH|nr:hypothetical protein FRX31_012074 [Thalictrum thalictroides]
MQKEIQQRPLDNVLAQLDIDATETFLELSKQEEASLFQKAKQKNVLLGDGNNSNFHRIVQGRKNRNIILSITDLQGNHMTDANSVNAAFLSYYHHLLGEEHQGPICTEELGQMQFVQLGNNLELDELGKDVTEVEIKHSLFDIEDTSAPGEHSSSRLIP